MKKTILSIVIIFSLATPIYAQVAPTTDEQLISALQQVVVLLQQQLALLIQQLQAVNQTNESIGSQLGLIVQNTTPVLTVGSVPSEPVPVDIQFPDTLYWGHSGNCAPAAIGEIKIKYSDGSIKLADNSTKIYLPDGTQGELRGGNLIGGFWLRETNATTTKALIIKDNIQKEIPLKFWPYIIPEYNYTEKLWKNDDGTYIIKTNGEKYDPITHMCGK